MSIDERLRIGLVQNTDHLSPDLEHELATTYTRARVREVRRGGVALAVVAAVAAAIVWYGDVPALRDVEPLAPDPESRSATDLVGVEGPLEPGRYSLAAWGESTATGPLPRTILEVPEGYFSAGGYSIEAGQDGVTDDQLGNLTVWHVRQVLTDPCHRRTAVDAGTSVEDLARALVRQAGPSTGPEPVVLDGHPGVTLSVTIPPDTDLNRCTDGEYSLWRSEPRGDGALSQTTPGLVNRLWILDVDGTRLVLTATLYPDETDALHHEQISIAESADFVEPDA